MSVSENFDRKFSKCMRGYNPEEVDSAIDALLRYCDDLESANREFEVANNDLIDDKAGLTADKTNLTNKVNELSENLKHIENVYNEYRAKFGEARTLVSNAKVTAAEIMTRAQTKSDLLLEETENKRSAIISKLDNEIAERKALIVSLQTSFEKLRSDLLITVADVSNTIKCWNTESEMPQIPEYINTEKNVKTDKSESTITALNTPTSPKNTVKPCDSAIQKAAEKFQTSENTANSAVLEAKSTPSSVPRPQQPQTHINIGGIPVTVVTPPVTKSILKTETTDNSGAKVTDSSHVSKIKSSVDRINKRVIAKKSTPYI